LKDVTFYAQKLKARKGLNQYLVLMISLTVISAYRVATKN